MMPGGFGQLLSTEALAMGAIAANLGALNHDLETEMGFHLPPQLLERLPEKLLYFSAAETDDVGVFAFHPGLVVVLIAVNMHEVELVHQSARLQHFQRPIHRHPVEFGIDLFGHFIQPFSVEVLPRFVDQLKQDLALPGEPDAPLFE